MKIQIHLAWQKKGTPPKRLFKNDAIYQLAEEYVHRIRPFAPCTLEGQFSDKAGAGTLLWLCDKQPTTQKATSSESIAQRLENVQNQGTRDLKILIGGPDGFSEQERNLLNPNFIWSFGPLTLPHELASLVALEQVYRAFTILKRHPYHLAH